MPFRIFLKKVQAGQGSGKKKDRTGKHYVLPYGNGKNRMIGDKGIKGGNPIADRFSHTQF